MFQNAASTRENFFYQKTVCNKLYVLTHEVWVHSDQITWKGLADKLCLNFHSFVNNLINFIQRKLLLQQTAQSMIRSKWIQTYCSWSSGHWDRVCNVLTYGNSKQHWVLWANVAYCYHTDLFVPVQETSKVTVEPLVSRYKLVWEGQTRHKTPLLKPEDGTEAAQNTWMLIHESWHIYDRSLCQWFQGCHATAEEIYLPEKNIPSTHANATSLTANDIGLQIMVGTQSDNNLGLFLKKNRHKKKCFFNQIEDIKSDHINSTTIGYLWIQSKHHFAFLEIQGMVSIALNNLSFSFGSFIYVSRSKLYISDKCHKKIYLESVLHSKERERNLQDHSHI